MKTRATDFNECKGCTWRIVDESTDFCGMQKTKPKELPCHEHDQFAIERSLINGSLKRNPYILQLFGLMQKGR